MKIQVKDPIPHSSNAGCASEGHPKVMLLQSCVPLKGMLFLSLVVSAVVSTASTLSHLSASITAGYHAAPVSVLVYNQEKELSFCLSGEWRQGRRAR